MMFSYVILCMLWRFVRGRDYSLYNDVNFSFSSDEFWAFEGLLDYNHEHIHMKWVANINDYDEQLFFIVNGEKLWAMHMT